MDLEAFRQRLAEEECATQQTPLYVCAGCSKEVKLQPKDSVNCKECGFKIMFKKRQRKAQIYDCV
jgi:DNA-directed RNA polymerase I, II, and III subunit RPABC4